MSFSSGRMFIHIHLVWVFSLFVCFHFFLFTPKNIQTQTSNWCILLLIHKRICQNQWWSKGNCYLYLDTKKEVFWEICLNRWCLYPYIMELVPFFSKPSVHIYKQTLVSLQILTGVKLNISICVSGGRENTNTSWVVLDRMGSGSQKTKRSEWGPCVSENTTRLQFRRDIEWRAQSSFFCPTDNDILISTCRVIDPELGMRRSLSRLDHSGFHNNVLLMALFADVQYEGQAFSFFFS